jgi:hypothetical protein
MNIWFASVTEVCVGAIVAIIDPPLALADHHRLKFYFMKNVSVVITR